MTIAPAPRPMFVSLRLRSAWRADLVFESSMPGAQAYAFHRSDELLRVTKQGLDFARSDGGRSLWLCGDVLEGTGRGRFGEVHTLSSGHTTFHFDWRDDAATRRAGQAELVHVTVDGSEGEAYRAWAVEPGFFVTPRTHVRVEALADRANLDRMVGLLAYFWSGARAMYERRG